MIRQNIKKKKIFLVGAASLNFDNLTIEALENIRKSDFVILDKNFSKEFVLQLQKVNKKIYFSNKNLEANKNLLCEIQNLNESYSKISILKIEDPIFSQVGVNQYYFLKKHGFEVQIISGIISLLDFLNSEHNPITDRKKNSSVNFIDSEKILRERNISYINHAQKIVIKMSSKIHLGIILKQIKEQKNFKKITFINTYNKHCMTVKNNGDYSRRVLINMSFNFVIMEKV